MKRRATAVITAGLIALTGTLLSAGVANAGSEPAGAHVFGEGFAIKQGEAYAMAQKSARSKCASNQVVQRISQKLVPVGGHWAVDLVLVCG